jgi:hypothetical protein
MLAGLLGRIGWRSLETPANRWKSRSRAGPVFTDEIADAIYEGGAGRRSWFRRSRCDGGHGRLRRCWRNDGYAFHAALENQRGADANAAHQNDHARVDLGLDFGAGVVNQRGHEDLIDGLFPGERRIGGCQLRAWFCFRGFLARLAGGGELADFGRTRRSCFRGLQITNAVAGAAGKVFKLPVEDENVAGLGKEKALAGQLLIETDGAAMGADAHGARGVETDEDISRRIGDGEGLGLDLGSEDLQGEIALDIQVNRAGIEGDGQRAIGLEDREMRGTANTDLAAFHKIDSGSAGVDAHVAAAAEEGFRLAVDDFDTHGSGDADGFTVDDADRVRWGFVGARRGSDEHSAEGDETGQRKRGATWACDRIGKSRHSATLPATEAESLAYTIRRRLCGRMQR